MEPSTNDILRDRGLALQAIACARLRDLGCLRAGARAAAPPRRGARPRTRCRSRHRRLLPPGGRRPAATRSAATWTAASPAASSRSAAGSPEVDAQRVRAAREAAGPDFALMVDANQGYDRATRRSTSGAWSRDLDLRWFEEPCRWTNDRRWMRDVRLPDRHPRLCRPERDHPARHPRPGRGRRDRRLELRRVVGRRSDDLAQGRRPVRRVRGPAGPPRGAPGLGAPARLRAGPHLRRVLRRGARPVLLEHLRPVHADPATGGTRSRRGPGLGLELDWDYVRAHHGGDAGHRPVTSRILPDGRPAGPLAGRPRRRRRAVRRRRRSARCTSRTSVPRSSRSRTRARAATSAATSRPGRQGEDSLFFEAFNRGKRCVALDLKNAAGRSRVRATGRGRRRGPQQPAWRPAGAPGDHVRAPRARQPADRVRGPDRLRPARPGAPRCPGTTPSIQAEAGWAALTGDPDGPSDQERPLPGRLHLRPDGVHRPAGRACGTRERTGRGRDVDTNLYDSALAMLSYPATWYLSSGFGTPACRCPRIPP